jgi:ribosome-binding protein aMBF1 (putative translation factor)
MKADLYRRAFSRALEISGSRERLAAYLGARPERLENWLAGRSRPPVSVLQALARLLQFKLLHEGERPKRRAPR